MYRPALSETFCASALHKLLYFVLHRIVLKCVSDETARESSLHIDVSKIVWNALYRYISVKWTGGDGVPAYSPHYTTSANKSILRVAWSLVVQRLRATCIEQVEYHSGKRFLHTLGSTSSASHTTATTTTTTITTTTTSYSQLDVVVVPSMYFRFPSWRHQPKTVVARTTGRQQEVHAAHAQKKATNRRTSKTHNAAYKKAE